MTKQQKTEEKTKAKPKNYRRPKAKGNRLLITNLAFTFFTSTAIVISGFFGHYYDPTVKNGLIPILICCFGIGAFELSDWFAFGKSASILGSILAVLVLVITWQWAYWLWPPPISHEFHVGMARLLRNDGSDRNLGLWRVTLQPITLPILGPTPPPRFPASVLPVAAGMFIQFTNESERAFMIGSFRAEILGHDGQWQPMKTLAFDTTDHWLIKVEGPHKAGNAYIDQFNASGDFQTIIDHRNINRGETVEGWVIFGSEEKAGESNLRLRVHEVGGAEYVEPMEMASNLDTEAQTDSILAMGLPDGITSEQITGWKSGKATTKP